LVDDHMQLLTASRLLIAVISDT